MTKPDDLRRVVLKHQMTEGKDCVLEWKADFGKMELLLYVTFISPALLLDYMRQLPNRDERFQKTKITTPLQIGARFKIRLCVSGEGADVWYAVRLYQLEMPGEKHNRLEMELTPISSK